MAYYRASGLLAWHLSVLPGNAIVITAHVVGEPLYREVYQVIVAAETVVHLSASAAAELTWRLQ